METNVGVIANGLTNDFGILAVDVHMSFTPFVDFAVDRDHDGLTEVLMSSRIHRPGYRALHSHRTHVMYFFCLLCETIDVGSVYVHRLCVTVSFLAHSKTFVVASRAPALG